MPSACQHHYVTIAVAVAVPAAAAAAAAFRHQCCRRSRSGSGSGCSGSTATQCQPAQAGSAGFLSWVGAGWDPIWIGWGPIRIGWGPIRIGWGRHQLQPSLPSHSLIYKHCFTPSSFDSSRQLFIQQILIHCFHCGFIVIVIVGIVITVSLLL